MAQTNTQLTSSVIEWAMNNPTAAVLTGIVVLLAGLITLGAVHQQRLEEARRNVAPLTHAHPETEPLPTTPTTPTPPTNTDDISVERMQCLAARGALAGLDSSTKATDEYTQLHDLFDGQEPAEALNTIYEAYLRDLTDAIKAEATTTGENPKAIARRKLDAASLRELDTQLPEPTEMM